MLAEAGIPFGFVAELFAPRPQRLGVTMQGMFFSEADGAMHLMGNGCRLAGGFAGAGFGRCDGEEIGRICRRFQCRASCRRMSGKGREMVLHRLELGDFPAKLLALKGVGKRELVTFSEFFACNLHASCIQLTEL